MTSRGKCPSCELDGKFVSIVLNHHDFWECPECGLQFQFISDNYLGILEIRGNRALKTMEYDPEKWGERVLLRRPLFEGDDCIIKNSEELTAYLSIVDQ